VPIASGRISGESIFKSFLSIKSLLAIAIGVLVAWLGGRGVKLKMLIGWMQIASTCV
jgi:uncharacterized membrane protein (DUF441 family)